MKKPPGKTGRFEVFKTVGLLDQAATSSGIFGIS